MRKMKFTKLLIYCFLALLFTAYGWAQELTIVGKVLDENGLLIPGANISVKGTQKSTTTDFDGNYKIVANSNATLVFSFVGYSKTEELVKGRTKIDVNLKPEQQDLKEVVVIGYGKQKKRELTGAVAVVDSKIIENLKPTRIEQALQGQVAGVNITTNTGSPGGASTISIRGISTNGDNRPLILVDGNVVEDLSVVNPSDIDNINILKDATAGIYGVRAANGVILITTKTGRKATPLSVEYNAWGGFQQTTRKIPVLNATEYGVIVNEGYASAGSTPPFNNLASLGIGTNWQDEVFQSAPIVNHSILIKGGRRKSSYSFSSSFLTQDGIVGGDKSNFNRSTNSFSYNLDILKNLRLKSGLTFTNTRKNNLPESTIGSVLFNALNMAPNIPVRDLNGAYSLADGLGAEVVNPLAQIDNVYDKNKVKKFNGFGGLAFDFLKYFTAEANMQFNYSEVDSFVFEPLDYYGVSKVFNTVTNTVSERFDIYRDYTFDGFLKYENKFKDVHKLNVLVGTSVFKTTGEFSGRKGTNLISNDVQNASVSQAAIQEDIFQARGRNPRFDARLLSYFTRLQYDYKGKYLISGVLRRDGSTRFAPDNRFGFFPSGSLGWIVSDEKFMNKKFFDLLKFRASYGILGNDRIGDYRYVSLLTGEGTYFFGGNGINDQEFGAASGGISNPEIKWEKQKTLDFGLDMRIFNNKVDITADYFKRRTENLLVAPEVSGLLGTGAAPFVNAGVVENKGFEFSIGYSDKLTDDLKFSLKYNVTTIQNEVVSVSGQGTYLEVGSFGISQPAISRMEAGFPLGYFVGFKTDGVFQTQDEIDNTAVGSIAPQIGDFKYVDQNNDGKIDLSDRVNLGDPLPDATMGLNITIDYKKFDFGAYAFASIGNEIVRNYERNQPLVNKPIWYLDRWTGVGSTDSAPRQTIGTNGNTVFSDFYVEDGSFVRLQNIQLGYTISKSKSANSVFDKFRIYVSANNLLTLTRYRGYDPTAGTGAPIGGGIDQGFYPSAKMYLLGVNVKF